MKMSLLLDPARFFFEIFLPQLPKCLWYFQLNTINTCFKYIFHYDLKDNVYGQVYGLFLEILHVATRIGIHRGLFVGMISSPNISRNFLWRSHFLIKTQDYSLQPRTILNSITDKFLKVF